MKILAIETATEACSAALAVDDAILERYELAPRRHAELILNMVDQILSESGNRLGELDALAFGRGPGGFTGVRIATGVAQGLAFGAELPVIPISTLAALAQSTGRAGDAILAAMDARMGEVYWGLFKKGADGTVQPVQAEQLSRPEQLHVPPGADWQGVGSAWQRYEDVLSKHLAGRIKSVTAERFPQARCVAALARKALAEGNTVAPEQALPSYLRNRVTG